VVVASRKSSRRQQRPIWLGDCRCRSATTRTSCGYADGLITGADERFSCRFPHEPQNQEANRIRRCAERAVLEERRLQGSEAVGAAARASGDSRAPPFTLRNGYADPCRKTESRLITGSRLLIRGSRFGSGHVHQQRSYFESRASACSRRSDQGPGLTPSFSRASFAIFSDSAWLPASCNAVA
jgi:hypothetical protein